MISLYQGTQSYMGNEAICVDFYTYGTNEDGKLMIDQIISLLAHISQNDQNHRSLELEIVVKRVVLVFFVCFVVVVHLLINKGIVCSNSSVAKVCYNFGKMCGFAAMVGTWGDSKFALCVVVLCVHWVV